MKHWDRRSNYSKNPNWDTSNKKEARLYSVIRPYKFLTGKKCLPHDMQYWTMCGAHYAGKRPNVHAIPGELGQVTSEGLIKIGQWRGVDRESKVIATNRKFYPEAWWGTGDFYEVMREACWRGEFNPGFVNYDGIMGPECGVCYLKNILFLIDYNVHGPLVLVANFVLRSPYRADLSCDAKDVLLVWLKKYYYPVPDHWSIVPVLWNYRGGASIHSSARMGTFIFVKAAHVGQPKYTPGRNLLLRMK